MQLPLLLAFGAIAITSTEASYPYGSNFHLSCANYTSITDNLVIYAHCKLNPNRPQDKQFGDPEHGGWRATSLDLNKCLWYDPSETTLQWIAPFCNMALVDTPPKMRNHTGLQPAPLLQDVCRNCSFTNSTPRPGSKDSFDNVPGERLLKCDCRNYVNQTHSVSVNLAQHIYNGPDSRLSCFGRTG
ncbi:hypothetical protein B0T20DRAFT_480543 [Sordaria brevicollis]|uniref:Cyanovirin-N domain-containing protein n=1 Tax=Sordaria brevicollis TaxID=83679 RepID=A0AAE0PBK6_SORBR|nr:hypothetical protein B0T20DRAFT_480543 [Sordaria brevicollis]